ncbi:MAG TPA: glycoside hydrolase family 97 catalytic domain-containing protein [Vicinamibacterales bacterium]
MIVVLLLIAGAAGRLTGQDRSTVTVSSPDGRLVMTFAPVNPGTRFSRWEYRLEAVDGTTRQVLLDRSPIGLQTDRADFTELRLERASEVRTVRDAYEMPHGKRRSRVHEARERDLHLATSDGARFTVTVRVADDGAAFRYVLPEHPDGPWRVRGEHTGFAVPPGSRSWLLPHTTPGRWAPAYEDFFVEGNAGGSAPTEQGWSWPALFQIRESDRWVLVTEAAVGPRDAGTRLAAEAPNGVYRIRYPDPAEGLGQGEVAPTAAGPWGLPWRVVIAGSPGDVVSSTLVEDLNAAADGDYSWVKPGRASFGWWIDDDASKKEEVLTKFIDLAAAMGWEYSLIDANWHLAPDGAIDRVIAHAKEKNVGLFLWYNSGGPHNDVTEWGPRDRIFDPAARRAEFARLKPLGIAGVKVDFWHSDKPSLMALYHDVLRDAADAGLMVVLHGATTPRGWSRTYPHLLSVEAVLAAEQYKYSERFAKEAARHNTILPFTRNVIGPMDYTPVTLSDAKYPHETTNAHELALPVIFESGIVHFPDSPEAYNDLPPTAIELLKAVPVAWDDTRLLDGEPGRLAVIARRHGDTWWVGAISGVDAPSSASIELSFLEKGEWELTMVRDGGAPRHLMSEAALVRPVDRFNVPMLPRGGFVMRLEPK